MSQEQALSQFCEPPQTGGQKATLGSQKLVFVSSIIPASYTTHIGAPPYPLHAPSMPAPCNPARCFGALRSVRDPLAAESSQPAFVGKIGVASTSDRSCTSPMNSGG